MEQQIHSRIKDALPNALVELTNESHLHSQGLNASHFRLTIIDPSFLKLNLLERHQLVNQVLAEVYKDIHALALHTYTPKEWANLAATSPKSPACRKK